MCKYSNFIFASMAGGIAYFSYDFMGPVLSLALTDLGLNQAEVGYFFLIYAVAYLIGSVFSPYLDKYLSGRTMMIMGAFIEFIALLLMGPSAMLNIEPNIWIMGAGQFIGGIFLPLLLVPCLPEMIKIVDILFWDLTEEQKAKYYDFSSGLFNSSLGMGQTLGPLFAANIAAV